MNNSTVTVTAQNKLIAAMLQDINPTIYQACIDFVQPMVTNIDQLPVICDQIREVKQITNENMAYYIAVLMRLYSPAHLYIDGCRLPIGLRDKFAEYFNFNNPEMWNHYATPVRSHMKNSRFANAVNVCAYDIAKILKNSEENQVKSTFKRPVSSSPRKFDYFRCFFEQHP
jgi:hypothetical protein